jgi:hypothetical protein
LYRDAEYGISTADQFVRKFNASFTSGVFAARLLEYAKLSKDTNVTEILQSITELKSISIVVGTYNPSATRAPTAAPTTAAPTVAPTASTGFSAGYLALVVLIIVPGIVYYMRRQQLRSKRPENIYALDKLEKEHSDEPAPYANMAANGNRHEINVLDLDDAVRITVRSSKDEFNSGNQGFNDYLSVFSEEQQRQQQQHSNYDDRDSASAYNVSSAARGSSTDAGRSHSHLDDGSESEAASYGLFGIVYDDGTTVVDSSEFSGQQGQKNPLTSRFGPSRVKHTPQTSTGVSLGDDGDGGFEAISEETEDSRSVSSWIGTAEWRQASMYVLGSNKDEHRRDTEYTRGNN